MDRAAVIGPTYSRRYVIARAGLLVAATAIIALLGAGPRQRASASVARQTAQTFSGTDLAGWMTVLGDGVYAAPGEPPVMLSDIETVNFGSYSELRSNINRRKIMAHNIAFERQPRDDIFQYTHTASYKMRLTYIPTVGDTNQNAQTTEGGLFCYTGSGEHYGGVAQQDYGVAFQWRLNPYAPDFGDLMAWKNADGVDWQKVGHITPDLVLRHADYEG